MNDGEFVRLTQQVGYVLVDELPAAGVGCNILTLDDRELHIIRRFIEPFASWRTRYVRWLYGNTFKCATEEEYLDYQDTIGQLFSNIGGCEMSCQGLLDAIQGLADSLATNRGGGNSGGNCSGVGVPGQAAGFMGQYPNEAVVQPTAGSVVENVPPPGFDTWAHYQGYKCRAAQQVFAFVLGFCRQCQGLKLLVVTATIVGPLLAGWSSLWGAIAITPLGWVAAISSLVAIGILESLAFKGFELLGDYLEVHKQEIICSLYTSGDAVAARTAIAGYIEDGIQAIEWSTIGLEALGPAIAALMGDVMAVVQQNGVVNILFEAHADIAYPDAVCDCAQPATSPEFHFNDDAEGWTAEYAVISPNTFVWQWLDSDTGKDPSDISAGRLVAYSVRSAPTQDCKLVLEYNFSPMPVAPAEGNFQLDVWQGASGGSCSYYVRIRYSDNSEDQSVQSHQDSQWKHCSVAVSSGNVGKPILSIYVIFDWDYNTTGACDFAIDNVITAGM